MPSPTYQVAPPALRQATANGRVTRAEFALPSPVSQETNPETRGTRVLVHAPDKGPASPTSACDIKHSCRRHPSRTADFQVRVDGRAAVAAVSPAASGHGATVQVSASTVRGSDGSTSEAKEMVPAGPTANRTARGGRRKWARSPSPTVVPVAARCSLTRLSIDLGQQPKPPPLHRRCQYTEPSSSAQSPHSHELLRLRSPHGAVGAEAGHAGSATVVTIPVAASTGAPGIQISTT